VREHEADDVPSGAASDPQGAAPHTDVSLWFVFDADRERPLTPDLTESAGVRWFPADGAGASGGVLEGMVGAVLFSGGMNRFRA